MIEQKYLTFPRYEETKDKVLLCPSLLAADFFNLEQALSKVQEADFLHLDVMDGHFVPNLSFGAPVLASLKDKTSLLFDAHLMVQNPDMYIEEYAKLGVKNLSVHVETCPHLHRTLSKIKECNMAASVVLNPSTPLITLEEVLEEVDMILLMSVNPGFGGQKFIASTLNKVWRLRNQLEQKHLSKHIQIDGGVGLGNIRSLYDAGANVFVAGSSVFLHQNPDEVLKEMRSICKN